MSDLVRRLREPVFGTETTERNLMNSAADRIEELEAKLATCEKYRDAYAEMGRIGTEAVRDLEAKLAEARCEIDFCNAQLEAWQTMAPPATKGLVRKRLEELKKGT